ncbi:PAN2-PAN3 deadenylation complex catalytic subunit PAN2 isoform X2 [Nematostella vectensis]|uniref:PAN2-PAN3 deadenylation complex catalytic subunit PAN2 isoform X2 n=1 Tax=Nematostella vectensis TaxID=45351 RepID=UPI0020776B54|nr:PAN2-PAN3 deadenylation complex catalytic subunit PAN2 isoform X2 [Nematostella vectensis]
MELEHESSVVKEEYQEIRTIFNNAREPLGITSVITDPFEELVWVGNQSGHISSFYGIQLQKYTRFQAHHGEIRHMLVDDGGVLSLSSSELRYGKRTGIKLFSLSGPNMTNLQCMLQRDNSNLLLAGHQDNMLEVDLKTGSLTREFEVNPGTVVMKWSSRYICCGDTKGKITLRDPLTLNPEHVLDAHSGTLSDFDVSGNLVVTSGFSSRQGHLAVDRILMMYDLRTLRSLPPMQVSIEPIMLRFIPTFTSRMAVISQTGQFQLIEPGGPMTAASMFVYHINTQGHMCSTIDISSNCNVMVFGDTGGNIHLYGDSKVADVCFNSYSRDATFANVTSPTQPVAIDDYSVPLSSYPLPFTNGPLLSDWPEQNYVRVDRHAIAIEPEILRNMVVRQFIGYAPNPGNKKRNQWPYETKPNVALVQTKGGKPEPEQTESHSTKEDESSCLIPKAYKRVEMKYSRLGIEDFDFGQYNKTKFAGLEIHIPNAYCNAMLQVLYYLEPIRVNFQNHLCEREFCLACELGFLFYMLDQWTGAPCQASNFLRAFRTIPQASALGLVLNDVDESAGKANFPRLIQSWIRFVLQQTHQDTLKTQTLQEEQEEAPEEASTSPKVEQTSIIEQVFGAGVEQKSKCRCGKDATKPSVSLLYDLEYPSLNGKPTETPVSFESIIEATLCREQSMQAWCDKCGRYQPTVQSRKVTRLPDVLALNCHVEQEGEIELWKTQQKMLNVPQLEEKPVQTSKPCRYGDSCTRADCKFRHDVVIIEKDDEPRSWVPMAIKISAENGNIAVTKIDEGDKKVKCGENEVVYDLHATVGYIQDAKHGGNLVTHIHVGPTYHSRKEGVTCDQWYVFNDFSITPITPIEAVVFNLEWKVPCGIMFVRRDLNSRHNITLATPIKDTILYSETSVTAKPGQSRHFTPLTPDELPSEGGLVALDAEFVTLNQEEAEIRSDGTRSTIKPSQMSVARITVVRGEGPLKGVPFIDDYISTSEQVVDYLTKFSGIKPGDLDATMSSKHLTTLKTTYLKIRALVDRKVKFVGHGLKKDFRVINILVPKGQVFDTVGLFHLPRQRYLSLRFLAWYFLGLNIHTPSTPSRRFISC